MGVVWGCLLGGLGRGVAFLFGWRGVVLMGGGVDGVSGRWALVGCGGLFWRRRGGTGAGSFWGGGGEIVKGSGVSY